MAVKIFTVPTKGIGRKDYSNAIEFATYATSKGLQARFTYMAEWTDLPTLAWPDFYVCSIQFFDEEHALTYPAPGIPYHLYQLLITGESNALIFTGFYRFNSEDDIWSWNVDKWYGDMFGYGRAELNFSKGIKTVKGKWYIIAFAQYIDKPTFSVDLTSHWLSEEVIFPD